MKIRAPQPTRMTTARIADTAARAEAKRHNRHGHGQRFTPAAETQSVMGETS